jgi:hypothetical protein
VQVPCGHLRILPAHAAYLAWGPEDPHHPLRQIDCPQPIPTAYLHGVFFFSDSRK